MSTRSSETGSSRRFGTLALVVWLAFSVVVLAVAAVLGEVTDAVNVGYVASMLVFGFAVVATAAIIARIGQRVTPSVQGPSHGR